MSSKIRSIVVLCGVVALIAVSSAARAAMVNWDHAFALRSASGFVNPAVLVGFNPQPEPPGAITELDLSLPRDPILILRNQENPPGGLQMFDVFLAIGLPAVQFDFSDVVEEKPSLLHTRATSMGGDVFFDVFFEISSSTGGLLDPASLVGFNPQPEQPAGFMGAFGASFGINGLSDAFVTLRIFDGQGNQLSFASAVPEPASLALLGFGLAALAWRRTRRKV